MALVIAHRGASAYELENSLAAFRVAREMGADGVELDVHHLADAEIVVHHDPTLSGKRLDSMTLEEVKTHRLPSGDAVPTLAQALETVGPDVQAFIEAKSLDSAHDVDLFDAIDNAPEPSHCHVHAFDHRIVQRLRRQRPALRAGLLQSSYPVEPARCVAEMGVAALWQHEVHIDGALVEAVHRAGAVVYAWTVDDPHRMRELLALGIDGICSNKPDLAREVVQ